MQNQPILKNLFSRFLVVFQKSVKVETKGPGAGGKFVPQIQFLSRGSFQGILRHDFSVSKTEKSKSSGYCLMSSVR